MSLIEKMKSKFLIHDELQKLHYLSNELREGKATEADKPFWDESLEKVKVYADYWPKFQDTYKKYKKRRDLLDNVVRLSLLQESESPILVASGLEGDFSRLKRQRDKHQQEGDVIVVMGGWMKDADDIASVEKAMDLAEEGVIFLKGKTEELFLDSAERFADETFFIETLPTDIRTTHLVITTGNSATEPIDFQKFFTEDMPNMTGRTLVFLHPDDSQSTTTDNERHIVALSAGDALRLSLQ